MAKNIKMLLILKKKKSLQWWNACTIFTRHWSRRETFGCAINSDKEKLCGGNRVRDWMELFRQWSPWPTCSRRGGGVVRYRRKGGGKEGENKERETIGENKRGSVQLSVRINYRHRSYTRTPRTKIIRSTSNSFIPLITLFPPSPLLRQSLTDPRFK